MNKTQDGSLGPVVNYNDRWFRLLLAFTVANFVVIYGSGIPFGKLIRLWGYYLSVLPNVVYCYVIIWIIARFTRLLDGVYPWRKRFWVRLGWQLLACIVLPLSLVFMLVFLYFEYRGSAEQIRVYVRNDFSLVIILVLGLNGFYVRYYYNQVSAGIPGKSAPAPVIPLETLPETEVPGQQQVAAEDDSRPEEEVAFYRSEDDHTFSYYFSGACFLESKALKTFSEELHGGHFFNIRKGILLNHKVIRQYERGNGRSWLLTLHAPFEGEKLLVSQRRFKAFIAWYEPGQRADKMIADGKEALRFKYRKQG